MASNGQANSANRKRKLVIDTDAGIDDAQAILMALSRDEVDIVAITTVHGNTDGDQVPKNVLRLLKVADRLDIPVHKGARKSLIGTKIQATHYHGMDGFGDVPDPDAPGDELVQEEFAVNTLVRLANQYKGELELICLAPLTNVAMALRTDADFGKNLKHCYIMGGNYEGKGNMSPCAEFNFYADPEAAHIVLNDLGCPITMACWELCLKYAFSWEWYDKFINTPTKKAAFLKHIEKQTIQKYYDTKKFNYQTADQIIMAAVLVEGFIMDSRKVFATVELRGHCRGQMVVDWTSKLQKDANVCIVLEFNNDLYDRTLLTIVS